MPRLIARLENISGPKKKKVRMTQNLYSEGNAPKVHNQMRIPLVFLYREKSI